jgi:hypothetical protein
MDAAAEYANPAPPAPVPAAVIAVLDAPAILLQEDVNHARIHPAAVQVQTAAADTHALQREFAYILQHKHAYFQTFVLKVTATVTMLEAASAILEMGVISVSINNVALKMSHVYQVVK